MDVQFALFPILLMGLLVLAGGAFVLVAILAVRNRSTPRPTAIPSPPPNREARREILQQLSEQRITVEQAEVRLTAMGNPVPANFPQQASASSSSTGCLVAGLITLALIVLGGIAVAAVLFLTYSQASVSEHPTYRAEVVHDVQSEVSTSFEAATDVEAEVTEEMIETWEEETE